MRRPLACLETHNQKLLACGCSLLHDGCGPAVATCHLKPNQEGAGFKFTLTGNSASFSVAYSLREG